MTTSTPTTAARNRIPSFPVLFGTVVGVCMLGMALNLVGAKAYGVVDEGPRTLDEQLAGVLTFGSIGIVVCLSLGLWLAASPARSRIGAIVFGALSVPCLVFFFSGLPGMLGTTAAALAGLTRGRTPAEGAPRTFGLIGLVIALLNIAVAIVGITVAWLSELA